MRKILFLILFFWAFSDNLAGQSPSQASEVNLSRLLDYQKVKKLQSGEFLPILLYKRYKEYLIYKNAHFKGFSFDVKGQLAQNRFWHHATIGIGAFTRDFKDPEGRKVGGVLFEKPVYLGWDFQLYNQLQFSVGSTFLEQRLFQNQNTQTLLFNPFLGLSGKFKIVPSK